MRPDLETSDGRRAYQQELRRLMRVPRILGFLLVAIGTAIVIYAQRSGSTGALKAIGFGVLAVGWLNLFATLYYRARYHRARMKDDPEAF